MLVSASCQIDQCRNFDAAVGVTENVARYKANLSVSIPQVLWLFGYRPRVRATIELPLLGGKYV